MECDHGIDAVIKALRTAVGDSAENPQYIETVARRGYCLLLPVERLDSTSGEDGATGLVSSSRDVTVLISTVAMR